MLINNPVSAAPGFKIKNVWVMAGVPSIMQLCLFTSLNLNYLKKAKSLEEIKIYKAEGEIANILASIQNNFPKIDIELPIYAAPKFGTNIVFKGTSELKR